MAISIGDRIVYEDRNGARLHGEIVDIFKNHSHEITDYYVKLDLGRYVNVKPNYPNWCKLKEPALVT